MIKFIVFFILLFPSFQSLAQTSPAVFRAADSTNFSINHTDDWEMFNSYVAPGPQDSVQMELIIQHADNIDWATYQFIGSIINAAFIPSYPQEIPFSMFERAYVIRIDKDGRCYLKLTSIAIPDVDPVVVLMKIIFKNTL